MGDCYVEAPMVPCPETLQGRLAARAGVAPSRILLVIDGARPSDYSEAGLREAAGSFFEVLRAHLMQEAEQRGIPTLDLEPVFAERFRQDGRRCEFALDGHWDGHGHEVAAQAVVRSPRFTSSFGGESP